MPVTYDTDFYLWTQDQAERLRAAAAESNLGVDWTNVAEEIESLGISQRRELASRLSTIIEHLLKLTASPAIAPRNGWIDTIETQRFEIERLLESMPSLRQHVPELASIEFKRVTGKVVSKLARYGETGLHPIPPATATEIQARVLDETFIPHPPEPSTST